MPGNNSPSKSALGDGLQVANGPREEDKYPAVQFDNALYPIDTEFGGLCIANVENTKDQINATPDLKAKRLSEKRGMSRKRRSIYILSLVALLVIVGACVGGVLGSRKHKAAHEQSPTTVPSTTLSTSPSVPQPTEINKIFNGTSFAATAYPHATDQTQIYVLFYQHTNGDIENAVYNGSWQKPTYVTNDARLGTGLATAWTTPATGANERLWIYYIDKDDKLQELRGTHGNDSWIRGTLGNHGFEAASTYSALSMEFLGGCATAINAFLCYQTADGTVRQVLWNEQEDSWLAGPNFTDVKPRSDFVTHDRNSAWRVFMMNRDSQVIQYDCFNCCESVDWKQGVSYNFPTAASEPNGIGAINVGDIRLHYQSDDGIIRVLNYTGQPGNETFATSQLTLGKAMMGTKMAIADGSMWGQPSKAFYQTNGSDVTVTTWISDAQQFQTTVQLPLSP